VLIRDLGRLMSLDKTNGKRFWCSQCVAFSDESKEKLEEHYKTCCKYEIVKVVLPTGKNDDDKVKFKNLNNKFHHPISCYLDFESTLLKNYDVDTGKKTHKYQKHECNSVGIKFNCIHEEYSEPVKIFSSPNTEEVLKYTIETLEELATKSYKLIKQNEKINKNLITKEELKAHYSCEKCMDVNCMTKIFTEDNYKVLHHDHITGKYISTICNNCNLQYQYKSFMPVYIHNLKGYDAHFLVPALAQYGYKCNEKNDILSAIPCNEEKYISFSKNIKVDERYNKEKKLVSINFEIRFLDSLGFMPSSLCSLVENLKDGNKDIDSLRKAFKNISPRFTNDSDFYLMIQKGIYPYDYISAYEKLNETQLPSIYDFYSHLTNEPCNKKDYERAQIVFKHFNCKSILDYHNLYLTSDVLLLADVFEAFKTTCYRIYGLDPAYYYTSPGLSWDAFLKHTTEEYLKNKTNFEIELLTDLEMVEMFESGTRGGLSQISKRYAKANNK